MSELIEFKDFLKVDIRVGRIIEAHDFPEARVPSYKLIIDLGPQIGVKKSSAQITANYTKQELVGRLVLCVANFPAKQVANMMSEVLVLGLPDKNNAVVLIQPEREVEIGGRLY